MQPFKSHKLFPKNITHGYIYLLSFTKKWLAIQKMHSEMNSTSRADAHHEVRNFEVDGMIVIFSDVFRG